MARPMNKLPALLRFIQSDASVTNDRCVSPALETQDFFSRYDLCRLVGVANALSDSEENDFPPHLLQIMTVSKQEFPQRVQNFSFGI
jgi:hypothetical protein